MMTVVMIIVVIIVVMVVMAVAWIRDGSWGATVESDMAVHPIDVNVRSRSTLFLCRLLCRRRAVLVRMMRTITSCQKWREVFGSQGSALRGEKIARALSLYKGET